MLDGRAYSSALFLDTYSSGNHRSPNENVNVYNSKHPQTTVRPIMLILGSVGFNFP